MRSRIWAVGLVALFASPSLAEASLVTFTFHGTISDITDTSAPIDNVGGITIGSAFTGYFQYETAGAVDLDSDPNRGLYLLNTSGPASIFTMTVNGLTFTAGPGAVDVRNNVVSTLSPNTDLLNYTGGAIDTYPAGWSSSSPAATALQAAFAQAAGTLYPGDAIPTSFNPTSFDAGQLSLSFTNVSFPGGTDTNVSIIGDISLEAVPEPSSFLFATLAGAGLVAARRRRAPGADASGSPGGLPSPVVTE